MHRPRYGDWSLPKGKLEPGESDAEGAVREVLEETGVRCVTGPAVGSVRYVDRFGRPKQVVYFEMRPDGSAPAAFEPNDEIDAAEWLPADRAVDALTYAHDRELVSRIATRP